MTLVKFSQNCYRYFGEYITVSYLNAHGYLSFHCVLFLWQLAVAIICI